MADRRNEPNPDTSFLSNFVRDIPPVTRTLFFGTFFSTFLTGAKVISVAPFVLDWQFVVYGFQIWRPILSAFHAGGLGFGFLIHLYFIYSYSRQLEQNIFFSRTANYCWMLAICQAIILLLSVPFQFPIAGPALLLAIIHVWGRHAENVKISLYGVVQIPAKYLSIAMLVMNTVLSGSIHLDDIAGILAGHAYYWLDSIYPHMPQGRNVIAVPLWFERVISGIEGLAARAMPGQAPMPAPGPVSSAPRGSATGARSGGITRPSTRGPAKHSWGSGRTLGSS